MPSFLIQRFTFYEAFSGLRQFLGEGKTPMATQPSEYL